MRVLSTTTSPKNCYIGYFGAFYSVFIAREWKKKSKSLCVCLCVEEYSIPKQKLMTFLTHRNFPYTEQLWHIFIAEVHQYYRILYGIWYTVTNLYCQFIVFIVFCLDKPILFVYAIQILHSAIYLTFAFVFFFEDGVLTKEEILDKHDIFVGSQVTDFGEALARHDEF